jgi:phage baseplate assembly protein W
MSFEEEILGRGWAFPPKFDKNLNEPLMLVGDEDVKNSIEVIIKTKLGERILRDEFGSRIYELLFEPLTANMKTYMIDSLKSSLENNEPRIEVQQIQLLQPDLTIGRIDIYVSYELIDTNTTNNMVVPFYTPDNLSITGF